MKRAVCYLVAFTAFGCVQMTVSQIKNGNSAHCTQNCNCTRMDNITRAVCFEIPTSLDVNIQSLQVIGNLHYVSQKQISQVKGLQMLDLSGCNITDIEPGAFNVLNKLVSLKLSNNNLKTISNNMFEIPRLKVLNLDGNGLEYIEDSAFAHLNKLNKLYLQTNVLQQLPITLPVSLKVLDVSHNHISTITTDLKKIQLKSLNLCGNALNGFPSITSSSTLETLCLEGKATVLPHQFATNFPQLAEVTLVASSSDSGRSKFDPTTQSELSNMNKLIELSIVNFHLQNLSFLTGMKNLAILKLQNVTLESYHGIDEVLKSLMILSTLNIDQSPQLVKPILYNEQLLSQLTKLQRLSLRNTNLASLTQENVPKKTWLDISGNPLSCGCQLLWILHRERDSLGKFLLSKNETICASPRNVEGHTLLESVNILECPSQQRGEPADDLAIQAHTSDADMQTGTSTDVPMEGSTSSLNSTDKTADKLGDNTTIYIVLGTVLLILVVVGIALAMTLSVMKKRRKCQISPDGGETPMEQQQQQQMKKASSKDMLVKK